MGPYLACVFNTERRGFRPQARISGRRRRERCQMAGDNNTCAVIVVVHITYT